MQETNLDILIKPGKNKILINLKDNGIGFDQKEITKKGGLGLKSLHSRAKLLNGKIFLNSKRGTGAELIFEIPYRP